MWFGDNRQCPDCYTDFSIIEKWSWSLDRAEELQQYGIDPKEWYEKYGRKIRYMCGICGFRHPNPWKVRDKHDVPKLIQLARWGKKDSRGKLHYPVVYVEDHDSAVDYTSNPRWHASQDLDLWTSDETDDHYIYEERPHIELPDSDYQDRFSAIAQDRSERDAPAVLRRIGSLLTAAQASYIVQLAGDIADLRGHPIIDVNADTLDGLRRVLRRAPETSQGWSSADGSDAIEILKDYKERIAF